MIERIRTNGSQRAGQDHFFQIGAAVERIRWDRSDTLGDLDLRQAAASAENMAPAAGTVAVTVTNRCVGPALGIIDFT